MNITLRDIIKVDEMRTDFLLTKKYKKLINTYKQNYPYYVDQNNELYWERKIKREYGTDYLTRRRIKLVGDIILNLNNRTLLDVGIGQAYLEKYLSDKHSTINIFGIDIVAHKKKCFLNGKYKKVKSFLKLPFTTGSFNVITALEVMEHLKPRYLFSFLKEIYRVLDIEGKFIVSVPINEPLELISKYSKYEGGFVNPNSHLRNYNKNLIVWELEYAKFEILNIYEVSAYKKFGIILNIVNKIIKRWQPNCLVIICRKRK